MQFLEKMMYLKKVILLSIRLYLIKLYKCQLTYFPEDRSLSVKCGALSSDLFGGMNNENEKLRMSWF